MRKKLVSLVILNIMAISMVTLPVAAVYEETLEIYEADIGGIIDWDHTYDHSEDPICSATLCIVADDVDSDEEDEVWVYDPLDAEWEFLGLLNKLPGYSNWGYYPGKGNPNQDLTTTCFDINPAWINGLPVQVKIEPAWEVEIETSTLTIIRCVPAPLFSDLLAMLSMGILAGVLVIRRKRLTIN